MIFNHLTRLAILMALFLIFQKGLHRKCLSFTVYLFAILICGSLMAHLPGTFWNAPFYRMTRELYAWLKILIALEIGYHVFRAFPLALKVARTWALLILGTMVPLVGFGIQFAGWDHWQVASGTFHAGTIWLFAGLGLLQVWYNLPLDRWFKVLIGGFVFQLLFGSFALSSFGFFVLAGMIDPAVASWWGFGAWTQGRKRVEVIA
jgi:hypothetical protein